MNRVEGKWGDDTAQLQLGGGVLHRVKVFTGALWDRLLIKTAQVLGLLPGPRELVLKLDAARVAHLAGDASFARLGLDCVLESQQQGEQTEEQIQEWEHVSSGVEPEPAPAVEDRCQLMRTQLQGLELIDREVEEELAGVGEDPCQLVDGEISQPMSGLDRRLLARIEQGAWNLEAVVFAIFEVDRELAERILKAVNGFPNRRTPEPAMRVALKSHYVIKLLKTKRAVLQAEISRLAALSARTALARPLDARRVRFLAAE